MTMENFSVTVNFRGKTYEVQLPAGEADTASAGSSMELLGREIARITGAAYDTIKIIATGLKGPLVPSARPAETLSSVGLRSGMKVMLVASAENEIVAVRSAKELPGLVDFDQELLRAARRRQGGAHGAGSRGGRSSLAPPTGQYTFGGYKTWEFPGLHPPPPEALQLLYRLSADPGVVAVMQKHRYKVGLLSEMPPEGKVGVSPVCVLGLNINAGQEIQLRLRTDDLRGFRKYERIRDTLLHELAHNEWGDHDNNFKELNSLLCRECEAAVRSHESARTLLDSAAGAYSAVTAGLPGQALGPIRSELDDVVDPNDVMAVTARSSGRTLRQLAKQPQAPPTGSPPTAITSSAPSAAVTQATLYPASQAAPGANAVQGPATAQRPQQPENELRWRPGSAAGARAGSTSSGSDREADGSGIAEDDEDIAHRYEHYDPGTAAAEAAMYRLGSLDTAPGLGPGPGTEQEGQGLVPGPGLGHGSAAIKSSAADEGLASDAQLIAAAPVVAHYSNSSGNAAPALPENDTSQAGPSPMDLDTPADTSSGCASLQVASTAVEPGTRPEPGLSTSAAPAPAQSVAKRHVLLGPSVQSPLLLTVSDSASQQEPVSQVQMKEASSSAGAGVAGEDVGFTSGGASDDVAAQKLAAAWAGLRRCCEALGGDADAFLGALNTLRTLLGNVVHFPHDTRYQQVRLGNVALRRRLGAGLEGAREVLSAAGFTAQAPPAAGGGGDPHQQQGSEVVMAWTRRDPGLVWLALSALQTAEEAVQAQLAKGAAAAP